MAPSLSAPVLSVDAVVMAAEEEAHNWLCWSQAGGGGEGEGSLRGPLLWSSCTFWLCSLGGAVELTRRGAPSPITFLENLAF